MWEKNGEHAHAIDFYLQVNEENCPDPQIVQETLEKALHVVNTVANGVDFALFLDGGSCHQVFSPPCQGCCHSSG